jgi:hypothetical protein
MPRVHLTGDLHYTNRVAAVEDDGKWQMFLPFPEHTITQIALVGSDRLVCLSEDSEICLIDWRLNKEIARRRLVKKATSHILVTADAEFIVIYHQKSHLARSRYLQAIEVLRAASLDTMVEGDALQWPTGESVGRIVNRGAHRPVSGGAGEPIELQMQGKVFEDDTGRLAFLCCDCGPTESNSYYGLCRIDRSGWSAHFLPIPNESGPWRWFSASGRYAIARRSGVPLAQSGTASEQASNWAAIAAGEKQHGAVLELWTIEPPRLERLIVLGRTFPEFASDVVWEPDETGFWVQLGGNSRPGSRTRLTDYQRVGLDGSLSPLFSFQRFRDGKFSVPQNIVGFADLNRVEIRAYFDSAYIQRAWCNSDAPFRMISEDEDGFRPSTWPYPPKDAVKRFLAQSQRHHVLVVHEFSEAGIVDALQRLTHDIRERLAALLQREVFELSFKVGERTMSEIAFFACLTQERIPVASALRELLETYLTVQPRVVEAKGFFRQIWGPENQGALGPAMLTLLRLDQSAHDVFRDYLAKRDGEHETYSTDVLMKTYIQETGWRDRAMVGFGVYFALIRHRDGRLALAGGLLNEYGLLPAAEAIISADDFASLIMQEIDQFAVNPGLNGSTNEDLYLALQPGLEMTEYGRQALAIIASQSGLALVRGAEQRGLDRALLQLRDFVGRKQ